ncbi:MAG: acyl-CoA dehydrogenase [Labilithrix sp.]|nr:acyl-CoA dehydrogenase [Labilithrix sp.]MCW5812030.1 acyl-CoA dehydrogenase [Labilithrix sp.]
MMDVLEHLLRSAPAGPIANLDVWFARIADAPYAQPIDRALWAGFEADRLGYAFVGGYQAALERLLGLRDGKRRSLAATESGGAHPRAIQTRLEDGVLRGEKTFATLATHAEELLVVASKGTGADGKNQLVLARLPLPAERVTIAPRAPTPFAPEIPHAKVTLDAVPSTSFDVLAGDAYVEYLKPFRTIEDAHVLGATLGYLLGLARRSGFDHAFMEGAAALVLGVREVALAPPSEAAKHVALAGLFTQLRRLVTEHDASFAKAPPDELARWRRDLGLLMVAEQARTQRTAAAWQALG